MNLLSRQIGVINFAPLKPTFMAVYQGASVMLPAYPSAPALRVPLQRNAQERSPGKNSLPMTSLRLAEQVEVLKGAYRAFQAGRFVEAQEQFLLLIHRIPLLTVDSRAEQSEVKELLGICREYVTAVRLKTELDATTDTDSVRAMELGAYFTHCNLQPAHLLLSLRLAMVNAFKLKNFITAASFARRLLELPDVASEKNAQLRGKAQKVLQKSELNARNEHSLNYDERNPFVLCCQTLTPIYRGSELLRCPYCQAAYLPKFKNQLCATCQLSQIGLETLGLVSAASR